MLSPRWRWRLERWRQNLAGLLARPRGERRPRLCPACGLLVGAEEKNCSHCGASMAALSFTGLRRLAAAVLPAETPISYTLLIVNGLFFLVLWLLAVQRGDMGPFADIPADLHVRFGAKVGYAIRHLHHYWRLVMPIFLHADLWHLLFNSFVLYQIGPQVEELFGSQRFLFLYLTTGVVGFVASSFWYGPWMVSVGSSGSLFGLVGVLISYLGHHSLAPEYRAAFIRWAVLMFLLGILFPFDNAAHVGGFVGGLILGRLVSDRRPATTAQRFAVWLMGWGAAAVILASLALTMLYQRGAG